MQEIPTATTVSGLLCRKKSIGAAYMRGREDWGGRKISATVAVWKANRCDKRKTRKAWGSTRQDEAEVVERGL